MKRQTQTEYLRVQNSGQSRARMGTTESDEAASQATLDPDIGHACFDPAVPHKAAEAAPEHKLTISSTASGPEEVNPEVLTLPADKVFVRNSAGDFVRASELTITDRRTKTEVRVFVDDYQHCVASRRVQAALDKMRALFGSPPPTYSTYWLGSVEDFVADCLRAYEVDPETRLLRKRLRGQLSTALTLPSTKGPNQQ